MLKITENIVNLFKETLNVNVYDVMMLFKDLDKNLGEYDYKCKNIIFINRIRLEERHPEIMAYMTIVHELTHLCQYEYNKSISIELSEEENAILYRKTFRDNNYLDRPLEIDAVLMELYYLFFIGMEKESLISIGSLRFKNNKTTNLNRLISQLESKRLVKSEFIDIMNEMLIELNPNKFNEVI